MATPVDPHLQLIDAYLDNELDAARCAELEAWLLASDVHIDLFVRLVCDHVITHGFYDGERASAMATLLYESMHDSRVDLMNLLKLEETSHGGELVTLPSEANAELGLPRDGQPHQRRGFGRGRRHGRKPAQAEHASAQGNRRHIVIPYWLAFTGGLAAVLAVAALLLLPARQPAPPAPSRVAQAPTQQEEPQPVVAEIHQAFDAVWRVPPQPDALRQGDELELLSGTAEILFRSDARIRLQGGTRLALTSPNRCQLETGQLLGHVPEQAQGFTVTVPGGLVRDLGTDFYVDIDDNGITHVNVLDGMVTIAAENPAGSSTRDVELTPGVRGEIDARQGLVHVIRTVQVDLLSTAEGGPPTQTLDPIWQITDIHGDETFTPRKARVIQATPNTLTDVWLPNSDASGWITVPGNGMVPQGQITTFGLEVILPENIDPDSFDLMAHVWVDDELIEVRINDQAARVQGDVPIQEIGYFIGSEMTIAGAWRPGRNMLEFVVLNLGARGMVEHPSALRVEFKRASIDQVETWRPIR